MNESSDPLMDPSYPQTQVRLRLERAQELLDNHDEITATGEFITTLSDAFPEGTAAKEHIEALCAATVPEITVDKTVLRKMIAEALGEVVAFQGLTEEVHKSSDN